MKDNGALRVAHVVFDLHGGGMESLLEALAVHFAGSRVRLSVVTLSGRVGHVGARVRPYLEHFAVIRQLPLVSMLRPAALSRELRAIAPDVVHLHSGSWYKGALAARLAGVPRVVYTEHGREHHDPYVLRWLDRRAARWTDTVVAVSERLRRYLVREVGVAPGRVCVIENAVDTERFSPGPVSQGLRGALDLPPAAVVVGSVGRLQAVKGYDGLLEAFARCPPADAAGRPVYLVVFGEGDERLALERRARALGVADRVRFPGWTDDSPGAYRLFDLFALASRSEGTSVSLLEAMASGVAPVVTDVGSNARVVGPTLASQLVPVEDVPALASRLAALVADEEQRAVLGRAARRRAVEHYGMDAFTAAYEGLYGGGAHR